MTGAVPVVISSAASARSAIEASPVAASPPGPDAASPSGPVGAGSAGAGGGEAGEVGGGWVGGIGWVARRTLTTTTASSQIEGSVIEQRV